MLKLIYYICTKITLDVTMRQDKVCAIQHVIKYAQQLDHGHNWCKLLKICSSFHLVPKKLLSIFFATLSEHQHFTVAIT